LNPVDGATMDTLATSPMSLRRMRIPDIAAMRLELPQNRPSRAPCREKSRLLEKRGIGWQT